MTAAPTRRRNHSDDKGSFRRAVPMAGTGDGPRPDPTTFASAARRATGECRAASNRTADDAPHR
ncbi:hypothetical protein EKH57_01735 [Halorubrum sp. BOL3-1]|uniref:hypothetical protein n=1 Tax=Halorubrum sp. BOL3-1 TaxID=2497325 RepID=UPI001004DEFD|nr:hypothetical protein [Halorubrum sp. BOL3-1]QAU11585.1 hypothetical protein EKH57_01735 [Halorubrum sp. BOL3-1]